MACALWLGGFVLLTGICVLLPQHHHPAAVVPPIITLDLPMLVDTHAHVSDRWYEPGEALLAAMDRAGVERAWLVQLLGVYDNGYQQAQAAAHRDRFVSIVQVDWTRSDAVVALKRLAADGAVGVRLRPGSCSPGDDPLAIWRAAADLGLIVSCVGTAAQFCQPDFAAVVAEVPALPIVLEHLGGLARPDVGDVVAAKKAVFALADYANLRLKLPGLGQLHPRAELAEPPLDAADPRGALIAEAISAFAPERLLWASDFPVVSTREGYGNALDWTRAVCPPATRTAIFGGNAEALVAAPA